ncbi:hypothetical protein RJ640_009967 [Escallonia rubra]|uniref:Protein kinase domain-containing protein n=1 Tax=Escallonia rubra TaxID=112253 RepID=A0AA88RFI3_9ASTE|nr:hypothetical protein RJ640_009967 [Escallonia rubra]
MEFQITGTIGDYILGAKLGEGPLSTVRKAEHRTTGQVVVLKQAEGCVFLVLEFCAGGNLASYIKHHGRVQECMAKRFMSQLGAGLEVLNSHCIIHRDLKPAVLIKPKKSRVYTYL